MSNRDASYGSPVNSQWIQRFRQGIDVFRRATERASPAKSHAIFYGVFAKCTARCYPLLSNDWFELVKSPSFRDNGRKVYYIGDTFLCYEWERNMIRDNVQEPFLITSIKRYEFFLYFESTIHFYIAKVTEEKGACKMITECDILISDK